MSMHLFFILHTKSYLSTFFLYLLNHQDEKPMKHLFLSVALTVICCAAFSQTKKTDSIKRSTLIRVEHPQLVQQKVWPIHNTTSKNNDAVIIDPRPALKTWVRL